MEEFLKESFYKQVLNLFQNAKKSVSTAVNMTNILKHLSEKLTKEIGRGFSYDNLKLMRKFYLSWSHYLILMRTSNEDERHFYVIESPEDILKDPYVLEFTGLPELTSYSESELEEKIIDHLQQFLLELGRGFTFVGRQVRFTFEEDHYRVDLVTYNRLLRCFVLFDLKIGKLKHEDIGQMQMYVNYYDRKVKTEDENPTIGIIICKDKKDAIIEMTFPENNNQIFASKYQTVLPSKEELQKLLEDRNLE